MLLLLACAKDPEQAPPSFTEASSLVLRDFESEEVADLAQVVADWLVVHVDEQEGFAMDTLPLEFYADMQPQPDEYEAERLIGIGVTHRVAGNLGQHVVIVPEADQSFADPSTYNVWDREITEGTAESFTTGGTLRTDNWIEKGGPFGVVIPYPMLKDYRWVSLTQGETLVFRSWSTESGFSDNGKNGLVAGFTIELWVPDSDGLIWFNASWADIVTEIDDVLDEDLKVSQVIDGTIDYMDGTAAHAVGAF